MLSLQWELGCVITPGEAAEYALIRGLATAYEKMGLPDASSFSVLLPNKKFKNPCYIVHTVVLQNK